MSLTVNCLSCSSKLKIAERLRGQSIRCPACQATIAVPSAEETPVEETSAERTSAEDTSEEVIEMEKEATYRLLADELEEMEEGTPSEEPPEKRLPPPAPLRRKRPPLANQLLDIGGQLAELDQRTLIVLALLPAVAFGLAIPFAFITDVGLFIIPVMSIVFAAVLFTFAGAWWLFEKLGYPGWQAIVPVMNLIVLHEMAGLPKSYVAGWFIPGLNPCVPAMAFYGLARNFGQGNGFAVGLCIAAPVFLPALALGKYEFEGTWSYGERPLSTLLRIGGVPPE